MTVYELIKELEKCDGEATVQIEPFSVDGTMREEPQALREYTYLDRKFVLIY